MEAGNAVHWGRYVIGIVISFYIVLRCVVNHQGHVDKIATSTWVYTAGKEEIGAIERHHELATCWVVRLPFIEKDGGELDGRSWCLVDMVAHLPGMEAHPSLQDCCKRCDKKEIRKVLHCLMIWLYLNKWEILLCQLLHIYSMYTEICFHMSIGKMDDFLTITSTPCEFGYTAHSCDYFFLIQQDY